MMKPLNKKLPGVSNVPRPSVQQTAFMRQFKPLVAQAKNPPTPGISRVAPPAFRPQPVPKVLQKKATPQQSIKAATKPQPLKSLAANSKFNAAGVAQLTIWKYKDGAWVQHDNKPRDIPKYHFPEGKDSKPFDMFNDQSGDHKRSSIQMPRARPIVAEVAVQKLPAKEEAKRQANIKNEPNGFPAECRENKKEGTQSQAYIWNGGRWTQRGKAERPEGDLHAEQVAYMRHVAKDAKNERQWVLFVQNAAPCPERCIGYFTNESYQVAGFIFYVTGNKGGYSQSHQMPYPFTLWFVSGAMKKRAVNR